MLGAVARVLGLLVPRALLLAIASALPASRGAASVQVGPVHRVTQAPFVFEPDLSVDPTNPNHLAATVAAAGALDCDSLRRGGCTSTLMLDTSQSGGATWQEQRLTMEASIDGTVALAPDGTLYEAGLEYVPESTAFFHHGLPEAAGGATSEALFAGTPADKPWLSIDGRTGAIAVPYDLLTPDLANAQAAVLERSTDLGKTWARSALPAGSFPEVTPGPDRRLAVAYEHQPASGTAAEGQRLVNVVTSSDGGKTFSQPITLGLSWELAGTASGGGRDYVAYFGGPLQAEQVTVATSADDGTTWRQAVASGASTLPYAPLAPAPALSVAPNGTVDLLYYAAVGQCTDAAAFRREYPAQPLGHWLDPCKYDVNFTFSTDDGQHWHPAVRLTQQPLDGAAFVQIPTGHSRPGEYMGLASTDRYAYALWIAPNRSNGTEAEMVRIRR